MKTSSEVATLVGIKRQRIQEYEKAGIALKPRVKEHGYWQYGEREIERLWQIKFYQELGFRVPDIKAIFDAPNYNRHDAIEDQINKLEEKKKQLESMIKIARSYNEMDVLPSDLCGKHNKLEDIPYEAVVPLAGKLLSLFETEINNDFWDKAYEFPISEKDEDMWGNVVGQIIGLYQKGVSYKDVSVQHQVDFLRCVNEKIAPESLIKQVLYCQRIIADAVDSNNKSISDVFGEGCAQYLNDAISFYYIEHLKNNPNTLSDHPISKVFCNIDKLARNRFTTGSPEVQAEVTRLHQILDDFGAFTKSAQLEFLSSVADSIGCKSTRKIFDNDRNHGICWFISRAIQIYCKHQQDTMTAEGEINE